MFDEEEDVWFGDEVECGGGGWSSGAAELSSSEPRKLVVTRRTGSRQAGHTDAVTSLIAAPDPDDGRVGFILPTSAPRERVNRAAAFRRAGSSDTPDA